MKILSKITLNEEQIINKVTNDRFGLKAATEWKKLIDPFTPRRTGRTVESAEVEPFRIKYDPIDQKDQYWLGEPITGKHYGKKIYYEESSTYFHTAFRYPPWCPAPMHNPFSTGKWDEAAVKAGKKTELYRTLNNALRSGNY